MHNDQSWPLDHALALDGELGAHRVEEYAGAVNVDEHGGPFGIVSATLAQVCASWQAHPALG
jgi:hypothetical protein